MKTKAEKNFDALLDKYFDAFGVNYPLDITSLLSTEDHIDRINKALSDKKPVVNDYQEGVIY